LPAVFGMCTKMQRWAWLIIRWKGKGMKTANVT
jgi:hypothetical protein